MAFTEDLTPFFAEFGDDATLAGAGVRVIFDGPGGNALGMGIEGPVVQIASADVPTAYRDAALVIAAGRGAGTYKVREHTPDGTGVSLLALTVVSA